MPLQPQYQSDLPADATAVVVARNPDGSPARTELYRDGAQVGTLLHEEDGAVESEFPMRDGLTHGRHYRFYEDGHLMFEEPYEAGLIHDEARQWSRDGRLIGRYTMQHGTGTDLWWQVSEEDPEIVTLTEVMPLVAGCPHGVQWWLHEGRLTLEVCWREGARHGVERCWNLRGRLRRGWPKYWIQDAQVDRRRYLRAAAKDPSLPPARREDDAPDRVFPEEIQAALRFPIADAPRVLPRP